MKVDNPNRLPEEATWSPAIVATFTLRHLCTLSSFSLHLAGLVLFRQTILNNLKTKIMKAQGLIAVALLLSGTAFAQQTSVKTEGKVTANSQTHANETTGNAGVSASNTTTVHVQSNAAEQAAQTANSQLNTVATTAAGAGANAQIAVNSTLQSTAGIGTKLENAVTGKVKGASPVNATVNQIIKIQAAPIRINTRIAGGVLTGIL
ncbi:hypothetical protein ACFOTA_19785 [Chitinophaga sp. GCM10012297]|uniref:Uncharacterized protein n=1 Tax=Chitinophaga chungangae TaxID=2821488 RepID=A0ABS3YK04_9BACT|nr:hypothetical protein [Chitinophaga chungangae]MBO9154464.1 hypothetical protein [Chitinophaga chungangae]